MEGCTCGVIQGTIPAFALRDRGTSVDITNLQAEI